MTSRIKQFDNVASHAFEALSTGLESARESATHVSRRVRDALQHTAHLGNTTSSYLTRRLAGTTHYLAQSGRRTLGFSRTCIHEHPLASTLAAFGAGLILARLLFRR